MQLFLQLCLLIIINSALWILLSVSVLSSGVLGQLGVFGTIIFPVSQSLKGGLIMGISQGLIAGLIIIWRKPDSFLGYTISNVVATEIFLAIPFIFFVIKNVSQTVGSKGIRTESLSSIIFGLFYLAILYYLVFSAILFIPSIILGVIDRLSLKFLFE